MNDEEIALLTQISERVPGAVHVAMELRYKEEHPEAWQLLKELGITGVDLYVLYLACGRDSHAVLVALGTGTAKDMLRANPESRLYVKPI